MPLSLLPYPKFNPVLISFGPFAIRWYALAHIGIDTGWAPMSISQMARVP